MAKIEIWRKVKDYHDEVCETCDEKVDYCECWRCHDCEELFGKEVESTEDDNGEPWCEDCVSSAYDRFATAD